MNKENLEKAIQLRRRLHQHPELSNRETWTKSHLIEFLKANTSLEIVDRGRWFYAIYHAGKDRPFIAYRADFDAIPVRETCDIPWKSQFEGVAHKCGHDGHSAALAAFALEVDQKGADKNICFLFQHAEETGDGAAECRVFIREHDIGEIFAYHNKPNIKKYAVYFRNGVMCCASVGMSVFFKGAPSHASQPERGINPIFAISEMVLSLPELIQANCKKGMVLCTVVNVQVGEEAYGVSPGEGVLRMTCRAQHEEEMNALVKNLELLTTEKCKAAGMTCTFEYKDAFPETANHAESADKVRRVCGDLGIEVIEMPEPERGSEDFGHYTKLTRGAMFNVGMGDGPPIHTEGYDFDDDLIETVVSIFTALIDA